MPCNKYFSPINRQFLIQRRPLSSQPPKPDPCLYCLFYYVLKTISVKETLTSSGYSMNHLAITSFCNQFPNFYFYSCLSFDSYISTLPKFPYCLFKICQRKFQSLEVSQDIKDLQCPWVCPQPAYACESLSPCL